jgi:hypothetical protein
VDKNSYVRGKMKIELRVGKQDEGLAMGKETKVWLLKYGERYRVRGTINHVNGS